MVYEKPTCPNCISRGHPKFCESKHIYQCGLPSWYGDGTEQGSGDSQVCPASDHSGTGSGCDGEELPDGAEVQPSMGGCASDADTKGLKGHDRR